MGVANPPVDLANIMQALVYTLMDVFDATRDLYQTLSIKEERDYELNLRTKGYPTTRRIEYVKDERLGSDEAIVQDKMSVTRQFEIGYQAIGAEFAMGDALSHTALQAQIITLQSVLVTTFLYGPTSTDPIAFQLSNVYAASKAAATVSVDILAALQQRQQEDRPPTPRSMHSMTARSIPSHALSHAASHEPSRAASHSISHEPTLAPSQSISQAPTRSGTRATTHVLAHAPSQGVSSHTPTQAQSYMPSHTTIHGRSRARSNTISHTASHAASHVPTHMTSHVPSRAQSRSRAVSGTNSASTALMKYQEPESRSAQIRGGSPVNTTVLEWRGRPKAERTDTDTTSMTGPTSYGMQSPSHDLYCLYAIDLQRHATQPLSACVTSDPAPYCPHCKTALHLNPGKAWEISKWDDDCKRTFQVQSRFVVKCHRDGPDGQYCCVICSKYAESDTVCGDVKALVKHLSDDHDIRELKHEEDVMEIIEKPDNRRDSGLGYSSSRGSRRSHSLASSRRRKSLPAYEREVEVFDMRGSRR